MGTGGGSLLEIGRKRVRVIQTTSHKGRKTFSTKTGEGWRLCSASFNNTCACMEKTTGGKLRNKEG